MSKPWEIERWRLGSVFIAFLIIGWLTGHWIVALLLPTSAYIAWNLYQIYRLEKWLNSGVKPGKAPEAGGIWAEIVQLIHRRERSEKKRKKRYKDLLARVNAVIGALPDAAVVLNSHDEIEWANDGAKTLLGIDRKRDMNSSISNLIRDPVFIEYLREPRSGRELEIPSPLDHKRTIVIRLTPFGKKQALMTSRDISQRVELGRVRKAFVANASHELRSPLTVIAGYLEILQNAPELPASLFDPVKNARDQATRMEGIIADLLTLSRLESSTLSETAGKELNVADMVKSVVTDLEHTVADGTHHFHLDLDETLRINAVEMEVDGVILNLCRNAVLHTKPGTDVFISWKKDAFGHACLTVRDTGDGIPDKHLLRLTERFYRVDAGRSRAVGGTGLGLSITRHVLERYRGDLQISSEVGKFAQFQARFPQTIIVSDGASE
ncbi:MAG: phosphate regulon sensor histidine kinase PhoR [Gammaproteobacteria bacterium]|nr:phosphate regulon sensor histidine kinase PhoR [Gammaproteobacteria bacterium]